MSIEAAKLTSYQIVGAAAAKLLAAKLSAAQVVGPAIPHGVKIGKLTTYLVVGPAADAAVEETPESGLEDNPFDPHPPEGLREANPELWDYLERQATLLRESHYSDQLQLKTIDETELTLLHDTEVYPVGTKTQFNHSVFGMMEARFVLFTEMSFGGMTFDTTKLTFDSTVWTFDSGAGTLGPVGFHSAEGMHEWTVTNRIGVSDVNAIEGFMASDEFPFSGKFGWIIVNGTNINDVRLARDETIEFGDEILWNATGEVTTSGVGKVAARYVGEGVGSSILVPGTLYINTESTSSLAGIEALASAQADTQTQIDEINETIEGLDETIDNEARLVALEDSTSQNALDITANLQKSINDDSSLANSISSLASATVISITEAVDAEAVLRADADSALGTRIDNVVTNHNTDFDSLTTAVAGHDGRIGVLEDSFSLRIGIDVQAQDAGLQSISDLITNVDQMLYLTAPDVYDTTNLTSFARTLLDDADAAAMRTTLDAAVSASGQPTGGTVGQVITKIDGTDFNSEWADSSGGGAALDVQDDGISIVDPTDTINFTGGGVVVTESPAGQANVAIAGIVGGVPTAYLHVRDEKANGTDGGALNSGTQTRTLNTVVTNTITGASLSGSNQVTLPAGTYEVLGGAPAHDVDRHKTHLYNITDAAIQLFGENAFLAVADTVQTWASVRGTFVLASPKVFELRHFAQTTKGAPFGAGVATSDGNVEVYATLFIVRQGSSSGVATFDELTDTPATMVGQAGKYLRVNSTPDALEYTDEGLFSTLEATDTTTSTSPITGSIKTAGGLGVVKQAYFGSNILLDTGGAFIRMPDNTGAFWINWLGTGTRIAEFQGNSSGGDYLTKFTNPGAGLHGLQVDGDLVVNGTTDSTSTTTGSIQTDGGLGIVKNLHVGGEVFLNLPTVNTGTSGSLWSDSGTVKVVP